MTHFKKILVVGATGMLGVPVTRSFVRAGFQVSALVRGSADSLPGEVAVKKGDIFDKASVDSAMEGAEVLYLNIGIQPTDREDGALAEREGLKNLLDSAKSRGVKRVILLTPLAKAMEGRDGFTWWVFREKQRAERLIIDSGIPYTIFRASSFFENLLGGMRRGNDINIAGKAQHPMWYIAADDYAQMVVKSIQMPAAANRIYVAQGPESLFPEQLVRRFVSAYTRERLSVKSAPLGILTFFGFFSRPMAFTAKLLDALNRFPEAFDATEAWNELGKPSTTIEDFARNR